MNQELIMNLVIAFAVPVAGALAAFIVKWVNAKAEQIKAQTNQDKIDQYIDILNETVEDVVVSLNQTTVLAFKEAAADGKLTKEEIEEVSEKAIDAVYLILGKQGRELLQTVFDDLDTLIVTKIERSVKEVKEF
jgi:alkyl hydroperoxide reductase subunit AhpF